MHSATTLWQLSPPPLTTSVRRAHCNCAVTAAARPPQASVHFSGQASRVIVLPIAVGPVDHETLFYVAGDHNGNSAFAPQQPPGGGGIPVKSARIDTLFGHLPNILYLKVDVEGFDVGVLQGAEAMLRAGKIRHLHFEYSAWQAGRGQSGWREVLGFLSDMPGKPRLYALHRDEEACFGPITRDQFDVFYTDHLNRHWQTDVYATFDAAFDPGCTQRWSPGGPS